MTLRSPFAPGYDVWGRFTSTAAPRPSNTWVHRSWWYADRDFPALLARLGPRVTPVPTHRAALSLTVAER